jgi:RecG-like helicase
LKSFLSFQPQCFCLNRKGKKAYFLPCALIPSTASGTACLFAPTGDQEKGRLGHPVRSDHAMHMNRLIQGDVGSGKTLVAAAAAYFSIKRLSVRDDGPTELLRGSMPTPNRPSLPF